MNKFRAACSITGVSFDFPNEYDNNQHIKLSTNEFIPEKILGKKGLMFKDRATLLALCAARQALSDAGIDEETVKGSNDIGVVVSSNLGNLDTLYKVIETIRKEHVNSLSPMDLPKASSNIIASNIAIRFGLLGPNFTLCNGSTSGIDAISLGEKLIRAGRANKMLVIGVETKNEFVEKLVESQSKEWLDPDFPYKISEGVACVILESTTDANERGAKIYGAVKHYKYNENMITLELKENNGNNVRWYTPYKAFLGTREQIQYLSNDFGINNNNTLDISEIVGDLYGALGVAQCALGSLWLISNENLESIFVATSGGNWGDGFSSIIIKAP
jgi:3-oxoacyl-[acyl-carrier-protein] synthase II